ncbi:MAG: membrane dipeptidase [Alphaproteobacteria bacterium]|nr:membrane dipeptidase [Alphaproteobacteria bacterium]
MDAKARALFDGVLVWDAHSCLPLKPGIDVDVLERHRAAGIDYVSINVGMDFNPWPDCLRVLAAFRAHLQRHPNRYVLVDTTADVARAQREGKLAVAFDLEGSDMLDGDLDMLRLYHDLGVRQIHFAYNRDNAVGGGCHGADVGLTAFGRRLVREVNEVGLIMDCSHTGHRSSLEIIAASAKPVVFSHTCVAALKAHPRNVRDDQIDACAANGGVVGITGIGVFLGANQTETAIVLDHVAYVADRVGPRHVGIGLDFEFLAGVDDFPKTAKRGDWWPAAHYGGAGLGPVKFVQPEQMAEIAEGLLARGWPEADVAGVLGGNFLRVAEATWRA